MVEKVEIVKLLDKNWIVDNQLKEYRDANNPELILSFREMNDLMEIHKFLKHPIGFGKNFGMNSTEIQTTAIKLGKLFERAINGDRSAFEEIADYMA